MPRPIARSLPLWTAAFVASSILSSANHATARPPASRLLPENTVFCVTVADVPNLKQRFLNTQLGRMSADPQLDPFVKHIYGSLADAVKQVQDRIDLGLSEMLALPQGEMTLAVVAPADDSPAAVLLFDVGDQMANALRLLKRGEEALEKQGVKRTEETIGDIKVTIFDGVGPRGRQVMWCQKETTVVLASNLAVLKNLLATWDGAPLPAKTGGTEGSDAKDGAAAGGPSKLLAENTKYAAVRQRCRGGKDEEPQIFWFLDPISTLEAVGKRNAGVQLVIAMLPRLGLDGLQAIGGSVALDAGQFDSISHFHVLMTSPRQGILDMIALEPGDTKPEPWVPSDVASYTTAHWNLGRTYTTLNKVYDSIRGEGAFATDVEKRMNDALGVEFAKDMLPNLDKRLTHMSRVERPITPTSQAWLLAVKLKDSAAMSQALEAVAKKNENSLIQQSFNGKSFYQVKIRPRPARKPEPGKDSEAKPEAAAGSSESNPEQGPPRPCFGVLGDCLVITDRASFYQKIITSMDTPGESLANSLEYKLVMSKLLRRGGGKPAMVSFNRPEEGVRFLYDLATGEASRDQLRKGAERNPLFKTLNSALDASPLPPFAVIQQYLAPGGAILVDDETGIHYTAFTFRRK